MGTRLQQLLENSCPGKYDIIATGYSGKGPQHYLEILRYDKEYFDIDTAITVHFSGNDFRNASKGLEQYNSNTTGHYFAYELAPDGNIFLSAKDKDNARRFRHFLEANHKPLSFYRLVNMAESHLLLHRVLTRISKSVSLRNSKQPPAVKGTLSQQDAMQHIHDRVYDDDSATGFIFREPRPPEVRDALEICTKLYEQMSAYCKAHNIRLIVVIVPNLNTPWYDFVYRYGWRTSFPGVNMTAVQTDLSQALLRQGIAVKDFMPSFQDLVNTRGKEGVQTLRSLFFRGGTGHFTPLGHTFCATVLYDSFFKADCEKNTGTSP